MNTWCLIITSSDLKSPWRCVWNVVISAFFWLVLAWFSFFGMFVSLYLLKCTSCRQHVGGSCFFIRSDELCLLIGVFRPLIFDVIIHMVGVNLPSCYLFSVFPIYPLFPFSCLFCINKVYFHHSVLSLHWLISYNSFFSGCFRIYSFVSLIEV